MTVDYANFAAPSDREPQTGDHSGARAQGYGFAARRVRPLAGRAERAMRASSADRLAGPPAALDALFALGLILSPASRLRLNLFPVGPGELCLLAWVLLTFGRHLLQFRRPLTPSFARLLVFWALFAMALSIGTITASAMHDPHDPIWFMHDVTAYPLLAAVSCASASEPDGGIHLRRVGWFLIAFSAACLPLQLAEGWGLLGGSGGDAWYWNRLRGWSQNPAQLAFLCAALTLLALHLAETASRPAERAAAVAGGILTLFVGLQTRTDAFTLVMVAAVTLFVPLKFRTWLRLRERRLSFRAAAAWIGVRAIPLVLASAAILAPTITAETVALAQTLSKDNGKSTAQEANLRFELWGEAWNRGLQSGMLGLGPGPHLPIPPSIIAARLTEVGQPESLPHPDPNNTPNFEAHDTLLDLFTQGGLLAIVSWLGVLALAIFGTYRAELAGLTTLLSGLLLFSVFDLIIRYPIFWYSVSLCLVTGAAARRAAVAQRGE